VDSRIDTLEAQIKGLRRQLVRYDHWHDTMKSPWWKRAWWWIQGYRLLSLGTWYKARWNDSARKYD
jgi:hypothetical protein